MSDSVARWLRRALSVISLVGVASMLGCGSDPRTFVPDTTQDATPDTSNPPSDASGGSDVAPDLSMGTDTGTDGARLDARDADGLTADGAADTARDGGGDAPPDLRPDIGVPDSSDVVVLDADDDATDVTIDNVNLPPTIITTIPADSAMAVSVTSTISVDFSKEMNPSTVTVTLQPAAALGTAIWNAGHTSVGFTPPAALPAMTSFTMSVAGSDTGARALAGKTTFAFVTGAGADLTPPAIRATVPAANATDVPAGTNIIVTFTEPMDVGSVALTSVPDITLGMPTWNAQSDQVSFTPTTALAPYTEYTITVTGQDPAKNALATPTTFKFTTQQPPDTTPPAILAVAPPNGATAVPSNSSIVITFSEAMNVQATTAALSVAPAVTCTGGWSWNVAATTTSCIPTAPLAYSTMYTVGVGVGATDVSGNPLASAFASSFITGVMPDTTPPTIVSVVPANGGAGITRSAKIVVTFSEAMDINSAQAAFSITAPIGTTGTIAWGNGNTQMVFTPDAQYAYGATLNWQVSTAAKDASGNAKTTLDSYSFNVIKSTTVNLPCNAALDGYIWGGTSIQPGNASIITGQTTTSLTYRGFSSFDMSALPSTVTLITSATLYLYQYMVAGTPYGARLGNVLWRHVDYGPTFEVADYNVAQLLHTASAGTVSIDATYAWKSSVVTLSVRDDFNNRVARGNRSQFLIRFTNDTAAPAAGEWAYFYSCEAAAATDRPYVSVTYEYP